MPQVVDALWQLIRQRQIAEATAVLFCHHKSRLGFWVKLKSELLRSCDNHFDLFLIATLLDASTKDTLEESCHFIPGLYSLTCRHNHDR